MHVGHPRQVTMPSKPLPKPKSEQETLSAHGLDEVSASFTSGSTTPGPQRQAASNSRAGAAALLNAPLSLVAAPFHAVRLLTAALRTPSGPRWVPESPADPPRGAGRPSRILATRASTEVRTPRRTAGGSGATAGGWPSPVMACASWATSAHARQHAQGAGQPPCC